MKFKSKNFRGTSQSSRRALRSSSKLTQPNSNQLISSSDQKLLNLSKKQFQQQSNNNVSPSNNLFVENPKFKTYSISLKSNIENSPKRGFSSKQQLFKRQSDIEIFQTPQSHGESSQNSLEQSLKQSKNIQTGLSLSALKSSFSGGKIFQKNSFQQSRKSYRKKKIFKISSVPFRKCQDSTFQQRIVNLINKLFEDKASSKDLQIFIQKLQRISNKDLLNPYVISGVQIIANLLKAKDSQISFWKRLETQISKVKQKVLQELSCVDIYLGIRIEQKRVNIQNTRPNMVKKVFKMLLETESISYEDARQKSLKICQKVFGTCQSVRQRDLQAFLSNPRLLAQGQY